MDIYAQWIKVGLAVYLLIIIFVSCIIVLRKRQRTMVEFFAAGRSFGSFPITFSMFATLFSAFTVIGMPGYFYTHGIGAWAFVVFADLSLGFVFYFYGRRVLEIAKRNELSSPVELLYTAYKSRFLNTLAVIVMGIFIMPFFSIQIAGMGKLLEGISGGTITYLTGAGIMLFAMVLYSTVGGLRADVWTDVIQGIIMLIVMLIVSFGFLAKVWHGDITAMFETVVAQGKGDLLSIPGPKGLFTLPALVSFFLLFLLVPITFPQVLSRFYAARSKRAILGTIVFFPVLTLLMFIPGVIIGIGGAAVFDLESGDMVMAEILRTYFHPSIAMIVIIGIVAAAMSTSDSVLLALGAMFSRDVYVPFIHPNARDKEQVWIGRAFMFLLMGGGFLIALNPPKLIVKLSLLSLEGMAILAPAYIGAVSSKLRSSIAAISSILVGSCIFIVSANVPKSWLAGFRPGLVAVVIGGFTYFIFAVLDYYKNPLKKES